MTLRTLREYLFGRRAVRVAALAAADACVVIGAVWAAFALRLMEPWPMAMVDAWFIAPLALLITLPTFAAMGVYRPILRFAGARFMYTLLKAVGLAMLLLLAAWILLRLPSVPRSFWINYTMFLLVGAGALRMLARDFLQRRHDLSCGQEPVLIYGAGAAGVELYGALRYNQELTPVGFVDDDPALQGTEIHGRRVHSPDELERLIARHQVERILLAMPSAPRTQRKMILDRLAGYPVHVMAMPGLMELTSGLKRIDDLQEVDIEDILGRDPVPPDPDLLGACIKGRTVMVTGAGGSIGSELCRQIIGLGVRRLVLFERSEYQLYQVEKELKEALAEFEVGAPELKAVLGSVTHPQRLGDVIRDMRVDTIYHAAAYKHVPLVEDNPLEGIRNNVFGTWYAAQTAIENGVSNFVLISTDKAVRPTNVMGASKRFAELVLQGLAGQSVDTRFSMVRFGNVLDSSGSVVPLFRQQIKQGGPVTVTDPEVTRYFMTISEAAQLVIQASAMAENGDVFLLDMGEPVKILDLARRMIFLMGHTPAEGDGSGTIRIEFTGLRPGEKLYEELLIGEANEATAHPMIARAHEAALPLTQVAQMLETLDHAYRNYEVDLARSVLCEAVEGYRQEVPAATRFALYGPTVSDSRVSQG